MNSSLGLAFSPSASPREHLGGCMPKRPPKGAWEQDAFTRWRHLYHWRPGVLRYIKRKAHKRERREGRMQARDRDGN